MPSASIGRFVNNPSEGSDALIHLRVPAATKARWVRESRKEGKKLTDWIVGRVEAKPMNVFKIPDTLADKYNGAGHALAATVNGQLVGLVYLRDVLPELELESDTADGQLDAAMLSDARLGPAVRQLQALGDVHVGMCSCWEFVEL